MATDSPIAVLFVVSFVGQRPWPDRRYRSCLANIAGNGI